MNSTFAIQAKTALSPEWDHGFDEAFTDLIASDPDLVQGEFDALIGANFTEPPEPPVPPAQPTGDGRPQPPRPRPEDAKDAPAGTTDPAPTEPVTPQRSPP
ncbi:hypothetical protein [Actinoplanes derwentensis]|uniref:Uncharacterized protein n=1 Tax=Actinoplanes derwentensis TaxID=113562 RepID=A0A1H2CW71_9ACTN|nr:hypothetical protein [Actinoplanes derwentensis]GID88378.1 hypothetical protein Ade03nite_73020 [Actinoplanes derwentensis]SDT74755.1 hypothetical protein SAMN04489716_7085 [Actinoplanes derwentensis]